MRFSDPQYFHLLWLVPALAFLLWAAARRRRRILSRFADLELTRRLAAPFPPGVRGLRTAALLVTLTLLIIALAGPQYGKQAVILSLWESSENAAWERAHKTFRMTEGWLVDSCLFDLSTAAVPNLTAVDRVSIYNTGLFFLPDGSGYGFTPLINDVSKPYVMDRDGRNKRDVSGRGDGFACGYTASPDGKRISYHEDYQVYVSHVDGADKRHDQV